MVRKFGRAFWLIYLKRLILWAENGHRLLSYSLVMAKVLIINYNILSIQQ